MFAQGDHELTSGHLDMLRDESRSSEDNGLAGLYPTLAENLIIWYIVFPSIQDLCHYVGSIRQQFRCLDNLILVADFSWGAGTSASCHGLGLPLYVQVHMINKK